MKCKICKKFFKSNIVLGRHISKIHNLTRKEYNEKFNLSLRCKNCNNFISNKSKSGLCHPCYLKNRTGKNHPLYGTKIYDVIEKKHGIIKAKKIWDERNKKIREKNKRKQSRVFVAGDLHGTHDIKKLTSKFWKTGNSLDKQDYLVIAGDFGFIWANEILATERYWMKWFQDKPWTTLVVPGNHENYNRIFALPITEMFGGKVRQYNDSVIFLERGETYTIANKTFWVMGGGLSIDKEYRIVDISYWMQELLTYNEMDYGIEKLQEVHGDVDYVITHAAPYSWLYKVLGTYPSVDPKYKDPTCQYLDEILKVYLYEYKCWLFGHYHRDIDLYNEKARGLYYEIVELLEPEYIISK